MLQVRVKPVEFHEGEVVLVSLTYCFGDSLLFCKVNIQEWWFLKNLLENYEVVYGQLLNKDKTTLFSTGILRLSLRCTYPMVLV